MPYIGLVDVPENLKKIDDIPLTLNQVNTLVAQADSMIENDIPEDKAWSIAIAGFKKTHKIEGEVWVKKAASEYSVAKKKTIGYHFSKKFYSSLKDVSKWIEINHPDIPGFVRQHNNEFYYGPIELDEGSFFAEKQNEGITRLYAMSDDDEIPETRNVTDVEVFKAGTWEDSNGTITTYTDEDIEYMAKNSRSDGLPCKISHWAMPEEPACGWLENLRVAGKSLIGDIMNIPIEIYKKMATKEFRKRSAEIAFNRFNKPIVTGLAILGSENSALPLKDIKFSENSNNVYCYSLNTDGGIDENSTAFKINENQNSPKGENKQMDDETKGTETESLKNENDALKAECDKLKSELEAMKAKMQELLAKVESGEKAMKEAEMAKSEEMKESYTEKFSEAATGKLTPAMIELQKPVIHMYCDNKEYDKVDEMIKTYSELPKVDLLNEQAEESEKESKEDVDETESLISKYCETNSLDINDSAHYAQAAIAVLKYEKPSIT